eukprot:SAG11_NODE_5029_length_1686_cov_0.760555_2_plen_124_part_00
MPFGTMTQYTQLKLGLSVLEHSCTLVQAAIRRKVASPPFRYARQIAGLLIFAPSIAKQDAPVSKHASGEVCDHIYRKGKDDPRKRDFEELPEIWRCPACDGEKGAYMNTLPGVCRASKPNLAA